MDGWPVGSFLGFEFVRVMVPGDGSKERTMGELAVFITSRAQPGKRDELFDLYRELLAPRAEANEAQEVVVWCGDEQDPDTFHLFEVYRDRDALGVNAQSSWFADYLAKAGPLLAGEPEVRMATPRWTTGL